MYTTLKQCIEDLERTGQLIRITEEVDPYLEMAAIHRRIFEQGGPAILYDNVKGSPFPAVSNLFGTVERSEYIFRATWDTTKQTIALRNSPLQAIRRPWQALKVACAAWKALPWRKKDGLPKHLLEIQISDLPWIVNWPDDGGAFVTLPQVYSEHPHKPGMLNANVGMYRVQISGNDYVRNEEVGIHYQIHRGIGVHQQLANEAGKPLKVSIFVGGPPAHTVAAVMPLPEGMPEMAFAGLLAGRRVRYSYVDGYCVSHDADFIITGEIEADQVKPEGPFGDHLGYYSLTHPFPVMKVHKVYAREGAIWPFTVVGRPPAEDTSFGELIHRLTGDAIKKEIPGVVEVHAVDAAGVHPLLLAIGSERYTPYDRNPQVQRPTELLTLANRILGTGQLSLAKYLFITAPLTKQEAGLSTHHIDRYLQYMLERIDLQRDVHLQTQTTIDTLDYSGTGLNSGSKAILAAYGSPRRTLATAVPQSWMAVPDISMFTMVMAGVVAMQLSQPFTTYEESGAAIRAVSSKLAQGGVEAIEQVPLIVIVDDAAELAASLDNFLWITFTRSNPSHDFYGINEQIKFKHWGCDSLIIDARKKPFHAPALVPNEDVERRAAAICSKPR